MKILLIIGNLGMGGAQRQLIELANYLKGRSINVVIIALEGGDDALISINNYNLKWCLIPCNVSHNPKIFLRDSLFQLIRFIFKIRRYKPDVIYSFTENANIVGALSWKFSGAKLFIWGQRNSGNLLRNSWLEKLSVRNVPLFISNSPMGKMALEQMFSISETKNLVIPNGVVISKPKHDRNYWRQKFNVESSAYVAAMVANITKYKDHVTALEAWAMFQKKHPAKSSKLFLIGKKGNTSSIVQQRISELGINDSVILTDFIEDISGILSICTIGIFTQKPGIEGLPNGVLECMAAGLPIVGSDIESLRFVLSKGNVPYLAEPGKAENHANQLGVFFANPKLSKKIGSQNKSKIETEFTIQRLGERTLELIHNNI